MNKPSDFNYVFNDFEGFINDAQRELFLRRIKEALRVAVDASCSCGGNPPGPAACPACMVWHRLKIKR